MHLVDQHISMEELRRLAAERFGDLIKAVVDIRLGVMVVEAQLHADEEAFLLDRGSQQGDLWGINIWPEKPRDEWIEFDSMINLRPSWGNRSRGVDDPETRRAIVDVVTKLTN
jgi:hypothetical protein